MAGFPDAFASKVIDFVTGRGTTPVYLALLTEDPGAAASLDTLPEDTTAGYARQPISWNAPAVVTEGTPPVSATNADVMFGPYTVDQAVAGSHVAIVTAASGTDGEVRWVQPLDAPFAAKVGDTLLLPAGSIDMGFLGGGDASSADAVG